MARRYADRITLDFFGDQLVCHLSPEKTESQATPYPRHFGVTFRERADFDRLLSRVDRQGLEFVERPFARFEGKPERHLAFFLADPSNNVLEFKYYFESEMMY